jgi:uncharacterized membrane protein
MSDLPPLDSATASPQPKPKSPLWMKIALTVSVVVNLGLIGMIAGMATGAMRYASATSFAVSALPEEARRDIRRELRDDFRDRRRGPDFGAIRRDLVQSLMADPFDPNAFAAALDAGQARMAEMGAKSRTRLIERVERMTPQERAAYAARLMERDGGRRP